MYDLNNHPTKSEKKHFLKQKKENKLNKKILAISLLFSTSIFACCSKKSLKHNDAENIRAEEPLSGDIILPTAEEIDVTLARSAPNRTAENEVKTTTQAQDPLRNIPRVVYWDKNTPSIGRIIDTPRCSLNADKPIDTATQERNKKFVHFFEFLSPELKKRVFNPLTACILVGETIRQENTFFWSRDDVNRWGTKRVTDTYRLNCFACGYLELFTIAAQNNQTKKKCCDRDVCKRVIVRKNENTLFTAADKKTFEGHSLTTQCTVCQDVEFWFAAIDERKAIKKKHHNELDASDKKMKSEGFTRTRSFKEL